MNEPRKAEAAADGNYVRIEEVTGATKVVWSSAKMAGSSTTYLEGVTRAMLREVLDKLEQEAAAKAFNEGMAKE